MYHNVLQVFYGFTMFKNVLQCLVSHATIGIAATATVDCLSEGDNVTGIADNSTEIADNSAEIVDNSAEIGDNSAEIGNNSAEIGNDAQGLSISPPK